ncbi:MAG: type III secretion system chaperone [Lentisphaeria bacterium]|nr:type III secretion system chaperone [Lentisphaeria bacterium]
MATIDDYKDLLATIRKQTGLDMLVPDDDGLLSFRVADEYNINLQFIKASGKILCFAEVATLPPDVGIAVYRNLLAAGFFGKDTAGGFLALEAESNTAIYNFMFDSTKPQPSPKPS